MIGKIMSETAQSIIGMLSAKPLGMETRTANNEFSSLLAPGEDRARLTVEDGLPDMVEDARGQQFLEQFVNSDAKPVSTANGFHLPQSSTFKASAEGRSENAELLSDGSFHTSVAASETERFISQLPVSETPSAIRTDEATSANGSSPTGPILAPVNLPTSDKGTEKPKLALDDVNKVASIPLIFVDGPAGKPDAAVPSDIDQQRGIPGSENKHVVDGKSPEALKPVIHSRVLAELSSGKTVQTQTENKPLDNAAKALVSVKPFSDADMLNLSKVDNENAEISYAPTTSQNVTPGQKTENLLDLRLANSLKDERFKVSQNSEIEGPEPTISADKPIKMEAKSSTVEIENLPAAASLDSSVETVTPTSQTGASPSQTATQKTLSFNWNAPQFAERFASEISDLRINGDLKKFEINPKNMGRLEISLVAQGANEIIRIEAESDAARDVIAQHSQAIQEMLKGQGRSDLILRVDVKENLSSANPNPNMNFEQQDSANANQERATQPQNRGTTISTGSDPTGREATDNSRYA
ncbi:flagellar hook-length control protein FliK [Parasphingorhabdus cellanae]|uniref:Flagellar hook-length control protein-like C-terminal domain-containing protein n=1 Tax=Parasphingorhabdus cellanae TaxID=2806553 RepID=A0ABX7T4I4_9SPHN|nr:flagellar hook-length control protein FliK [Parasphingorhabdus cellanae]QTD55457.1 hypothetical protein J4G78_14785 [Parasphingorhabdus cellanae]